MKSSFLYASLTSVSRVLAITLCILTVLSSFPPPAIAQYAGFRNIPRNPSIAREVAYIFDHPDRHFRGGLRVEVLRRKLETSPNRQLLEEQIRNEVRIYCDTSTVVVDAAAITALYFALGMIQEMAKPGPPALPAIPFPKVTTPATPPNSDDPENDGKSRSKIHWGQQNKHIEGNNNFVPGKSTLDADPQELVDRFAGRGEPANNVPRGQPGFKERFDTGNEIIGKVRDPVSGELKPTTRGMISYSKTGVHVWPIEPR